MASGRPLLGDGSPFPVAGICDPWASPKAGQRRGRRRRESLARLRGASAHRSLLGEVISASRAASHLRVGYIPAPGEIFGHKSESTGFLHVVIFRLCFVNLAYIPIRFLSKRHRQFSWKSSTSTGHFSNSTGSSTTSTLIIGYLLYPPHTCWCWSPLNNSYQHVALLELF